MKLIISVFTICAVTCLGQTQAPAAPGTPPPDTVIAKIEGKNLTYGELERFMHGMPPQVQQNAMRNRKQFIQQFALMQRLSLIAEKEKLDQKSPYKEALAFNRMNILMQAQINQQIDSFPIRVEEQQKYYDENKSRYQQVKLKVIYIPFSSTATSGASKKLLSEEQAKAKAGQIAKEAKAGVDFTKLVKENSQDETSKAKDGDFGTISPSDNLPDSIRSVVFGLKSGDISDPVRQPNGFYIFRADAVSEKPFLEVRDQIFTELKNQRLKEWLDATTKSLDIKFENEQFFSGSSMPPSGPALPNK